MLKPILVLSLILCGQASASITPTLSTVTGAGVFTFTYQVDLAGDQNANQGPEPGVTTPGGPNVIAISGDYFTIYDFYGYNGVHSEPTGWTLVTRNVGSTPTDTLPTDNASVVNLTWYRSSGGTVLGSCNGQVGGCSGGAINLGSFTAQSLFSQVVATSFTGQGTRNNGAFLGSEISNVGTVGAPTAIPEPGTYVLMSVGLGLLGLVRRRSA